jgi:hypothetical protein
MTGSRTIKVLVALVIAMTVGAFSLRLLETKPSPMAITDLMALYPSSDYTPDVPLATIWRNIVIHSSAERSDMDRRVHFIIDSDGTARPAPTALWMKQLAGRHSESSLYNYNADSIAVCVHTDGRHKMSARQLDSLVSLVRTLQQMCSIPAENVYPYSDINPSAASGEDFPSVEFSRQLLRSR